MGFLPLISVNAWKEFVIMPIYRSFAQFTKGASHIKHGLGCQDFAACHDHYADEKLAVAIVADGHGSPQYFRSDTGSSKAVEQAMSGIKAFVANTVFTAENISNAEIYDKLRRLASSIIGSWKEAVEADEKSRPLKDDKNTLTLEDKYRKRYLKDDPVPEHIHHAYGTTLIAVAVTENYWFGLHVGDGKCEVLFENGQWAQPIPWDQKCFLNSTTSICDDNALFEFRYWFGYRDLNGAVFEFAYGPDCDGIDSARKSGTKPVAIFIGSDGVDDTYPVHENEKHLKYLYRTVVLSFSKDGFESTKNQIKGLAEKLAEQGSQDDVSMAGIVVEKFDEEFIARLSDQHELDKVREKAIFARQKEEAKKNSFQAEQARAEKLKKQQAELENKAQAAKQDLEQKNAHLSHLQKGSIKLRIEEATKSVEDASANVEKIQTELESIDVEAGIQQEKVNIAEAEWKKADDEAAQLEEQCRSLELKSQTAL